MITKRLFIAILIATTSFGIFGCNRTKDGTGQTIPVGTILGLTGENSAYGIRMKKGLELALEHANASKEGSGAQFRLAVEDSQWEPRLGVSAYRKMHDVQGINHFAAICGSKIALAVCEGSRSDDIVIVDAISGAPKLTNTAGPKYFRVYASDAMAGTNNVTWALEEGAKTFAIAYVEDDWGASYKDAIVQALKYKGHHAQIIPVTLSSRDFKNEVQKLSQQPADAIFVVLYANLAVPFVKELRTLGSEAKIYAGDNLSSSDFSAAGNEVTDGVRLSLPAEPDSSEYKKFAEAYRQKFGEEPDAFGLKSYDAFMLLAHAIRATDGEAASVVNFLRAMPPYHGASGDLSFDANGDLRNQSYKRQVYKSGKLEAFGKN